MTALTFDLERRGPFDPDAVPYSRARQAWLRYRQDNGFGTANILTAPEQNVKLNKADMANYGLTLNPAELSGLEVCPWRTKSCTNACVLSTSFRGKGARNRKARTLRTRFIAEHPEEAVSLIQGEVRRAVKKARKANSRARIMVRLNVASDLRWEYIAPKLFDIDGALFYDYTKAPPAKHRGSHPNYRLTFSVSEKPRSEVDAALYMAEGGTAAVVFDVERGGDLPATWHGFRVIDGDKSDSRVFDPAGVVVGLRVKADGRRLKVGGFVKEAKAS